MRKVGVFICHCGNNIAGTIDVERVREVLRSYPGVVHSIDYLYICSDPGQGLIKEAITERGLEGIVVAACSPTMHETTFRRTVAAAGLNPYLCEMANIREQCSWVHRDDMERATLKAIRIIETIVEKVHDDEPLLPLAMPIVRRALIIGGGIAGLQAASDIAAAGYAVILVEREERLGGRMAQLSATYLNFDSTVDLLREKIEAVTRNPHITVLTRAQVGELGGYLGDFKVKVRRQGNDEEYKVGAIVVATGYDLYPMERLVEYGGGRYPDVIDSLQFERLLSASGPTGGEIRRPSDGRVPQEVVFVQCAGSRDPERGVSYCSKICCMYTAKQAMIYKMQVPKGQAYIFYIDIRALGKGYEEFTQRAMEEHRVLYLRGKVSKIFPQDGKMIVWGADTLSGKGVEVAADLVVLATPMVSSAGAFELAQKLRVATDGYGFFSEAHPKLRPVESLTAGVYLAGACQAPKDIPEAVAQGSAAAAKVLSFFSQEKITHDPIVAVVNPELCAGCGICVEVCPYEAREIHPLTKIAVVKEVLCQGCGACLVACPNKASHLRNFAPAQIMAMIEALEGG
ncbi:MAG: CoB--CoM heterodisulfide reductase iron-sulfur subunit A family protein [Anaerolineae bacterium]|nr:CoB--CoM heterodisulfide reductase iron-sulfur subunit A family protein [Anaerolineae bacterium]